jgi:Rad3-related DNA helicase
MTGSFVSPLMDLTCCVPERADQSLADRSRCAALVSSTLYSFSVKKANSTGNETKEGHYNHTRNK